MQRTKTTQAFLSAIWAEIGTIPRTALIWFGAVGALSALSDLSFWFHKPRLTPLDYVGWALLVSASFLSTYSACMEMIGCRRSWGGLSRFIATLLVMLSPILVAIALLALAHGDQRTLAASLVASLLGIIFLSFLPGWPVLQVTSPRLIGPWTAFKSTKGLRWQLMLASVLTSSLNKAVPQISTADNLLAAGLLAVLGGIVTCFSLMLAAAIAVSAWKHMTSEA